jgi:hypothetical protein
MFLLYNRGMRNFLFMFLFSLFFSLCYQTISSPKDGGAMTLLAAAVLLFFSSSRWFPRCFDDGEEEEGDALLEGGGGGGGGEGHTFRNSPKPKTTGQEREKVNFNLPGGFNHGSPST